MAYSLLSRKYIPGDCPEAITADSSAGIFFSTLLQKPEQDSGLLSSARMLWLMIDQLTVLHFMNQTSSESNSPLQMGSLVTPAASQ